MRKIFSALATAALAVTTLASCSSSEPSMIGNEPGQTESGARYARVRITAPADFRTRAADDALPLWNLADMKLNLFYCVYRADGSIYMSDAEGNGNTSLDGLSGIQMQSGMASLEIPLPAGEDGFKIFLWADQTDHRQYSASDDGVYDVNYTSRDISFAPHNSGYNFFNNSEKGDAFYFYGDLTPETTSIVMQRPFVQVNILSDEAMTEPLKSTYANGFYTYCGLRSTSSNHIYWPNVYNYGDDTVKMFDCDASYVYNNVCSIDEVDHDLVTPKTARYDGRTMQYVGCFYLFAPKSKQIAGSYQLGFQISNDMEGSGTTKVKLSTALPEFYQNNRIVIYNKSNGVGGLLKSSSSISVMIDSDYAKDNAMNTFINW